MKKYFLIAFVFLFASPAQADDELNYYFCGGGVGPDLRYYNLFLQENLADAEYSAFFRTVDNFFYTPKNKEISKSENIEEWQEYLGISYQEAQDLVLNASREDLQQLLKGNYAIKGLGFADDEFVKKHKQSLLYLAYAKYLEPYMRIVKGKDSYWSSADNKTVADLDYDKVISVLKQSWKAEKDKELKLRYGYQLVRFAHYNRNYQEALTFFEDYVESLHYKPPFYYYALEQKAGAENGLHNYTQANSDYLEVFRNTKDRKEIAYKSLRLKNELDLDDLLNQTSSAETKNNIYFLMGFNDFNNPISSFLKIVENSPNAPQARVLIARAINELERDYFPVQYYCIYDEKDCFKNLEDKKIPLTPNKDAKAFLKQTLEAIIKQIENPNTEEKEYWHLTAAYLYFIQQKNEKAKEHLAHISAENSDFYAYKKQLELLMEFTEISEITEVDENYLMEKYGKHIEESLTMSNHAVDEDDNPTNGFIRDVLANRYYLQKEYGKAFLLHNSITALEMTPEPQLFKAIKTLYNQPNKTKLEKLLVDDLFRNYNPNNFNIEDYLTHLEGTIQLHQGDFEEAFHSFEKLNSDFLSKYKNENFKNGKYGGFDGYSGIPNTIFGSRAAGHLEILDQMDTVYFGDFSFIKNKMNKKELAETLIQLKKIAKENSDQGAKANYLMANFFINTSVNGFYRHVLRFDHNNRYSLKYNVEGRTVENNQVYLKNYTERGFEIDNYNIPLQYIAKGLSQTNDKEIKARLNFVGAQAELGQFHQNKIDEFGTRDYSDSNYFDKLWDFRVQNYRKYFEKLHNEYQDTKYYNELKSSCKSFDYYTIHY